MTLTSPLRERTAHSQRFAISAEPRGQNFSMTAVREAYNDLNATLLNVRANAQGLTETEARLRLAQYGPNETAHEKAPHWSRQLLGAFRNPFIIVLAIIVAISLILDPTDLTSPIIIGTMITLSVILRFWQEFRSSRAAETLKKMVTTTASVMRRSTPESAPVTRGDLDP